MAKERKMSKKEEADFEYRSYPNGKLPAKTRKKYDELMTSMGLSKTKKRTRAK